MSIFPSSELRFSKGLNTDIQPVDQPEGSWRYAKNIVFSRKYNSLSNEDGLLELLEFPTQPIGIIPLDNDDFVVFCTEASYDEIGLVSNGTYTRILKTTNPNDRLGLSTNYPVTGVFRISNRGERIIAFIADNISPKVLNITTLPFPVDSNKIPTQSGSIATLNLFSAGNAPVTLFSLNQTGGFLKTGAYYFSSGYVTSDGVSTGYFTAAGPVKINDESTSVSFTQFDGAEPDTVTGKSVTITISDVDTRYRYLNIGVISVIAGETTFKKVGQVEITEGITDYTFTYTGNEQTEDLLLEQLLIQSQGIYQTAKAITTLNDKLVLGNLSSRPPFDYQSYANDIVINYTTNVKGMFSPFDKSDISALQKGGFRHFEVYAFYIWFRYTDGSYSPAYHIPGRVSNAPDLVNSSIGIAQGITAPKFQLEDTCLTDGTMSYWENEDETYPSDFPDFAGQNVRHHKFPSLRFIKENAVALGYTTVEANLMGITLMPILGISVSNVNIPSELASQIDGWQIGYAKRTISNQTCVGQGHLVFSSQSVGNGSNLSPNSNIVIGHSNAFSNIYTQELPFGDYAYTRTLKPLTTKLSFHSPDLLVNKPQIVPTFIRNEYKLRIQQTTQTGANSRVQSYEADVGKTQWMLLEFVNSSDTLSTVPTTSEMIRRVSAGNPLYVASNTISGQYFNIQGSEYINIDIVNGNTLSITTNMSNRYLPKGGEEATNPNRNTEETYLTNLCQLLNNVYSSFTDQEIVTASNIIPKASTTTTITSGGDNYVANYGSTTTMPKITNFSGTSFVLDTSVNTLTQGIKTIRHYACECNINIGLRHETIDDNSKYYPKSSYPLNGEVSLNGSFLDRYDSALPGIIAYNSDYSSVNTFNPVFPRNTQVNTLEAFPYRIIISERNADELADSGWRTFLPANYKDILTTKGEIIDLDSDDDVLLISTKYSLFRTIGSQRLKTSTEDVTIGMGDIFDFEPKEIISSELGYLGNQNKLASKMTKLGYTFFDASQGKLFIVKNDIKEISSTGLRNYFRDNLTSDPVVDNPFISTGLNVAHDEKYNRLLVSKKGVNPFTLSYSPDLQAWVSYHDYIPDYMFNTRNKLFSIKGNKAYLHNHTNKAIYYGTTYDSVIEAVFNAPIPIHFSNVSWHSDILKSDGTYLYHSTFDKILLYNSYQCSGEIVLIYPTNIFNSESTWNFNKFYDIVSDPSSPFIIEQNGLNTVISGNLDQVKAWFKQRRFIDKWTAARLTLDNSDQNTLFLYDVSMLMRRSSR